MHQDTVERLAHSHTRLADYSDNESRTLKVILLTTITMMVEISAGYWTGSMALLADGWHMGTHSLALGFSYIAYRLASKFEGSDHFSFGTGKMGVLAGYTSALFLLSAAIWMIFESITRLVNPVSIAISEAISITLVGLAVNLVSVLILNDNSAHHSHHDNEHDIEHHHDHNFRAAYLHVIADTLTSLLALVALLSARYLGWTFLDPAMGIFGGILICRWAYSLLKNTGKILLDYEADGEIRKKIKHAIESDGDSRIFDLHVWRIGSDEIAAIVSIVTGKNRKIDEYQKRIKELFPHYHFSVEVHPCSTCECECTS